MIHVDYGVRPASHSVFVPCGTTLAEVETATNRLRSWALIRGDVITSPPFLRLVSDDLWEVHLPTAGLYTPHPETGVRDSDIGARRALEVTDVAFAEVESALERLRGEHADAVHVRGVPELQAGSDGFRSVTLALPLGEMERPPEDLRARPLEGSSSIATSA
jgi:hypothetical protein